MEDEDEYCRRQFFFILHPSSLSSDSRECLHLWWGPWSSKPVGGLKKAVSGFDSHTLPSLNLLCVAACKADRCRLLHALYDPPPLKRGDRATCLYRDCDVVITSWTDARISWPCCRALHYRRGRPGMLVDDELLRAIRTESAEAIK
jgi:hypothetical protein